MLPLYPVFSHPAGSGYLTACFGMLVSPGGRVLGVEVVPELAARSLQSLKQVVPHLMDDGTITVLSGNVLSGGARGAGCGMCGMSRPGRTSPRPSLPLDADNAEVVAPPDISAVLQYCGCLAFVPIMSVCSVSGYCIISALYSIVHFRTVLHCTIASGSFRLPPSGVTMV